MLFLGQLILFRPKKKKKICATNVYPDITEILFFGQKDVLDRPGPGLSLVV